MKLVSFQDGEVVRRKKKEYSRNSLPHLFCFLFSGAGGVFSVPVNETFLGIISYYLCTAGKKNHSQIKEHFIVTITQTINKDNRITMLLGEKQFFIKTSLKT